MSVVDHRHVKVLLPRDGDALFQFLGQHFAQGNPTRWKYLAMLALRVNAGWSMEEIGRAFGHPKGHVSRCITHVKAHVRELVDVEPELRRLIDDDVPAGSN